MTCQEGRLQRRNLTYLQWHDDNLLIVNRVPASVCEVCGDYIYDPDAVEHLQQLLWAHLPEKQSPNKRKRSPA
jgi:YgiT-type zinc finger domain-containing protein